MTDKPAVTGTGSRYYAAVVTDRVIAAMPGEVCGHSHRTLAAAANCARRMHKRLTKGEARSPLRAFTVEVRPDGHCETPVPAGVLV